MKATAIAHPNIALVKYWGKRNIEKNLPENGSLSVNLGGLETKTTVEFVDSEKDIIFINNIDCSNDEKIIQHIERMRDFLHIDKKIKMYSESNFPRDSGIASSASGIAALTVAFCKASGKTLPEKEITILSRKGSGSSARSIPDGFVELYKGLNSDGSDCFAESIFSNDYWKDFRIVVCIVTESKKNISSTEGMMRANKSTYYKSWLDSIQEDRNKIYEAIKNMDIDSLGIVAENNSMKMHSIMMTSIPTLVYWNPETITVIKKVLEMRDDEISCYTTIDAGPQIKIMCLEKDVDKIVKNIKSTGAVKKTIVCCPGKATRIVEDHLF